MSQKTALVTGCLGQDASYLAELLIEKDYKVIGVRRRSSNPNYENVAAITGHPNFTVVTGDITDYHCVSTLVLEHKPDEIYNLAAQSFVKDSFTQPAHTFESNTIGVLNFLEVLRKENVDASFYQASTSEMFGKNYDEHTYTEINPDHPDNKLTPLDKYKPGEKYHVRKSNGNFADMIHLSSDGINFAAQPFWYKTEKYQDENTAFCPQSPYGIAKLAAHHLVRLYREAYGIKAACGILFNHESPRRGKEFVTRKITDYVGKLGKFLADNESIITGDDYSKKLRLVRTHKNYPKLALGNLDAVRDWGHAKDYVRAQWMILDQKKFQDFVICTGESHTVREFLEIAFSHIGLDYKDYVVVDPKFYRPAEVDYLRGDSSKARRVLGWTPSISFAELVKDMVESDIRRYADDSSETVG
jgi:GDPmannose 4,6-dehydratase